MALPKEEAERWLEEAEYDLEISQDNIDRYPSAVAYGKPFEFYTRKKAEECLKCAQEILRACRFILESI